MTSYFHFIEVLCQSQTAAIIKLDTPHFGQIVLSLKQGLEAIGKGKSFSTMKPSVL